MRPIMRSLWPISIPPFAGGQVRTVSRGLPLRETGTYETVYLQMPFQPFNDRNMFYVFTRDILSTDQGADRENPYNCPVVLRRAVTRTDFWFEKLPDWKEKTEGGIRKYPVIRLPACYRKI
ncbi:hypothetical protein NXW63_21295 [Parabacteroides distasonis]|nr:hypothetical protein [Parabacteroides distasonis]